MPAIWDSGVPHRAARRACPAGRFAAMKWVNIKEGSYKELGKRRPAWHIIAKFDVSE